MRAVMRTLLLSACFLAAEQGNDDSVLTLSGSCGRFFRCWFPIQPTTARLDPENFFVVVELLILLSVFLYLLSSPPFCDAVGAESRK